MADKVVKRTRDAAEVVLSRDKSVGPIELLVQIGFLHHSHVRQWQIKNPMFDRLEPHIQCGPKKLRQTWSAFLEWAHEKRLQPFSVDYTAMSRGGATKLKVCENEDEEQETFFRTPFSVG